MMTLDDLGLEPEVLAHARRLVPALRSRIDEMCDVARSAGGTISMAEVTDLAVWFGDSGEFRPGLIGTGWLPPTNDPNHGLLVTVCPPAMAAFFAQLVADEGVAFWDEAIEPYLRAMGCVIAFHASLHAGLADSPIGDLHRQELCDRHMVGVDRHGRPVDGDEPTMASALSDLEMRLLATVADHQGGSDG